MIRTRLFCHPLINQNFTLAIATYFSICILEMIRRSVLLELGLEKRVLRRTE
uniref:Uncharacterized protein n=1 Tax=Arundo donax TaxID=35708 RepID=A0A0A9CLE1_ARUDO